MGSESVRLGAYGIEIRCPSASSPSLNTFGRLVTLRPRRLLGHPFGLANNRSTPFRVSISGVPALDNQIRSVERHHQPTTNKDTRRRVRHCLIEAITRPGRRTSSGTKSPTHATLITIETRNLRLEASSGIQPGRQGRAISWNCSRD